MFVVLVEGVSWGKRGRRPIEASSRSAKRTISFSLLGAGQWHAGFGLGFAGQADSNGAWLSVQALSFFAFSAIRRPFSFRPSQARRILLLFKVFFCVCAIVYVSYRFIDFRFRTIRRLLQLVLCSGASFVFLCLDESKIRFPGLILYSTFNMREIPSLASNCPKLKGVNMTKN